MAPECARWLTGGGERGSVVTASEISAPGSLPGPSPTAISELAADATKQGLVMPVAWRETLSGRLQRPLSDYEEEGVKRRKTVSKDVAFPELRDPDPNVGLLKGALVGR